MSIPIKIQNFVKYLGIDKSIAYSSGARITQAAAGVVSIFFISAFLTKVEQGFYYTFGSIVAIQVFFELGLTNIITQYVAHEASHLKWVDNCRLEGDEVNHSRLAHLLRFSLKWYSIIGALLFVVLLLVGYIFFSYFSDNEEDVAWLGPWILICIGTGLKLTFSPVLAILMGLDKVKEVSRIRFFQNIVHPLAIWIGLIVGCNLYVVGISSLLSILTALAFVACSNLFTILKHVWHKEVTYKVSYLKEIFPYQWKIALSWVSGYFIFQLFNPVLFATEGAVVAGQMGMTITALNGIQALSMNWITTKVPLLSRLIALKNYIELDTVFNRTLKQMAFICITLLIIAFLGINGLRFFNVKLGFRFLPWLPLLLMMIPLYVNQFVNAWATYLRCHKQEPFLVISIVSGILCCLSTVILGKLFGVIGMTAGYCTITCVLAFWSHHIFVTKKAEWHEN